MRGFYCWSCFKLYEDIYPPDCLDNPRFGGSNLLQNIRYKYFLNWWLNYPNGLNLFWSKVQSLDRPSSVCSSPRLLWGTRGMILLPDLGLWVLGFLETIKVVLCWGFGSPQWPEEGPSLCCILKCEDCCDEYYPHVGVDTVVTVVTAGHNKVTDLSEYNYPRWWYESDLVALPAVRGSLVFCNSCILSVLS